MCKEMKLLKAMQGIVDQFYFDEAEAFAEEYLEDDNRPDMDGLEKLALEHDNNTFADVVVLKQFLESIDYKRPE